MYVDHPRLSGCRGCTGRNSWPASAARNAAPGACGRSSRRRRGRTGRAAALPGRRCTLAGCNTGFAAAATAAAPSLRAASACSRPSREEIRTAARIGPSVGLQPRPLLIAERRERLIAVVGHQLSRLRCGACGGLPGPADGRVVVFRARRFAVRAARRAPPGLYLPHCVSFLPCWLRWSAVVAGDPATRAETPLAESWPGGRRPRGPARRPRARARRSPGQPSRRRAGGPSASARRPPGGGRRTLVPSGCAAAGTEPAHGAADRRGHAFGGRSGRSLQRGGEQCLAPCVVHVQPGPRSPPRR